VPVRVSPVRAACWDKDQVATAVLSSRASCAIPASVRSTAAGMARSNAFRDTVNEPLTTSVSAASDTPANRVMIPLIERTKKVIEAARKSTLQPVLRRSTPTASGQAEPIRTAG